MTGESVCLYCWPVRPAFKERYRHIRRWGSGAARPGSAIDHAVVVCLDAREGTPWPYNAFGIRQRRYEKSNGAMLLRELGS